MEAPAEITTAAGLEPLVATPPAGRGRVRALAGIWVPAAMLIVIFFLCFIWPLIASVPSPTDSDILNSNLPSFSPGHLLGTDATGKDEWSRLLYGGRASLETALFTRVRWCTRMGRRRSTVTLGRPPPCAVGCL